jgi:hypothetical protein
MTRWISDPVMISTYGLTRQAGSVSPMNCDAVGTTASAPGTYSFEEPSEMLYDPLHKAEIIKHSHECDRGNDSKEHDSRPIGVRYSDFRFQRRLV